MRDNKISHAGELSSVTCQCPTTTPCRILVVEDEPCIRELSTAVLNRSGYQVDCAEDGAAGWEALQAKNYDLLITDNNMPKVTGIEMIRRLRSEDITLPVIMASGAIPTEHLSREPWLRLAATLLKPFTVGELLETVEKVLRESTGARSQAATYLSGLSAAVSQTPALTRGR